MLSLDKQILYILMRKPKIAISELLHIYSNRDYSAQSVRNALTRLKKSEYVDHSGHAYFLTPGGLLFIRAFQDKLALKEREWSGSWQLVTYQIPESLRRLRNTLRQELFDLGYGQLFQSVFISPHDQIQTLRSIFSALKVQSYVSVFSGDFIYGDINQRVQEIWDLKKINVMYTDFIVWGNEKKSVWLKEQTDSWDAFFHVLELGEQFGTILLKDPILPNSFLPADWQAGAAWDIYHLLFSEMSAHVAGNPDMLRLIKDRSDID